MFEYIVYSCVKKTEPDLSIPVRGQEVMSTNLPYRKFSVNIRVYFFSCKGGQTLEVCLEKLWSLQLRGTQNPTGCDVEQTPLGDPVLAVGWTGISPKVPSNLIHSVIL